VKPPEPGGQSEDNWAMKLCTDLTGGDLSNIMFAYKTKFTAISNYEATRLTSLISNT
jgi:hypothetical protein